MDNFRHDVHDHGGQHFGCNDPYCCDCECRACKRAWFALDRPRPSDCPEHGKAKAEAAEARPTFWERVLG